MYYSEKHKERTRLRPASPTKATAAMSAKQLWGHVKRFLSLEIMNDILKGYDVGLNRDSPSADPLMSHDDTSLRLRP